MGNFFCRTSGLAKHLSTASKKYDLLVIGGGSAGITAAKFAATFSKSVAIVEKARLGGDCTWTGCVPSKSLIASGKVAHSARNAREFGVNVGGGSVKVDMKAVRDRVRKNQDVIYQEDDSPEAMSKLGIDTIVGTAKFVSANTLDISSGDGGTEDVTIAANDAIIICTGAKPKRPTDQISGLDTINYLTYEEIFDLDKVPAKMTVVGGGPIGCELAQTYARLGAKVTLVARRLLPNEEPEAGEVIAEVFAKEGIELFSGRVKSVKPDGSNKHIATVTSTDGTDQTIAGDLMLVAVGRQPVASGMGLEDLGVEINARGGINVDAKLRTSIKGIYAAGDCTGSEQFTHYAGYQGAIAARNALLPLTDPGLLKYVPATTFTEPEVASVGLTESKAKEEYGDDAIAVAIQHMKEVDRAICEGDEDGFIKIVYKKKTHEILGATICSPVAGEMISEISVAMKCKLPFDQLATVMHTYPSYSFALQVMAADVYYKKLLKSKSILNFLKKIGL